MVTSPGARYSYCDYLPIIKVAVGNSAENDHGPDASSLRSSLAATALHSLSTGSKKPRPGLFWGTTVDAHEASHLYLSWFFIPSGSVEKIHQRRTEISCLFSYEGIPIQASKDAGLLPLPQVSAFSR